MVIELTKRYIFECKLKGEPIIVWGADTVSENQQFVHAFRMLRECGIIKSYAEGKRVGGEVTHEISLMRRYTEDGKTKVRQQTLDKGLLLGPAARDRFYPLSRDRNLARDKK